MVLLEEEVAVDETVTVPQSRVALGAVGRMQSAMEQHLHLQQQLLSHTLVLKPSSLRVSLLTTMLRKEYLPLLLLMIKADSAEEARPRPRHQRCVVRVTRSYPYATGTRVTFVDCTSLKMKF